MLSMRTSSQLFVAASALLCAATSVTRTSDATFAAWTEVTSIVVSALAFAACLCALSPGLASFVAGLPGLATTASLSDDTTTGAACCSEDADADKYPDTAPNTPANSRAVLRDMTNAAALALKPAFDPTTPAPTNSATVPVTPASPAPATPAAAPKRRFRPMTLPTDYQAFIHTSRYARYLDWGARRETWPETVARYFNWLEGHLARNCAGYKLPATLRGELEGAVLRLEVMPSMRALMTAGKALDKCHLAGYNCAYMAVDSPRVFDEMLFLLMNGTGVGFSVEEQFVAKLPKVADTVVDRPEVVVRIDDSREGWARGFRALLEHLWAGTVPQWDVSAVRPKGTRLKTFGGRASGPEPLVGLFSFAADLFRGAAGRGLTSLECHDLACRVAEVVVCGGVRRSALISLSDVADASMRDAKAGPWWQDSPQRAMANNSAVYTAKPDRAVFDAEWASLKASGSGERGMFCRAAAVRQAQRSGRRDTAGVAYGCNPCSEILLRPCQLCNLTEVVVRHGDTEAELERKVRLAATLGTFQATLLDLPYVREEWRRNTANERLLGVSMTGIMDSTLTSGRDAGGHEALAARLERLRAAAVDANAAISHDIGAPPSAAVTCVKPSGTVSQLVDAASGIHPRHAPFYVRRVRCSRNDPIAGFLEDSKVPCEPCVMKPDETAVFSFPIAAPAGAVTRDDIGAVEHLKLTLLYQKHWCEHKPSVTVTVREEEWDDVAEFVWENFDDLTGVAFLPHDCGTYQQMPYEDIDEARYNELLAQMPPRIDWRGLALREAQDEGGSRNHHFEYELACTANGCEAVDVH